jgi:polyribonucleotide nucleotidyltransferase
MGKHTGVEGRSCEEKEEPVEGPDITAVEAVIDNGKFGKRTLRFETGRLAQQADGAVAAYLDGDSMVLSTTVAGHAPKENYDFFPLTVDVQEKMYAAGRIPGSFFRREGRPSTDAILACRLIDRPLRPLFPHTLRNEVQIIDTVLAIDPDDSYDMIAMNAASASTTISGIPFEGPVAGVRLALIDGQWVAFPRWSEREKATFELVVAGRITKNNDVAIAMIEAGAGKNAWNLIYHGNGTKPDEKVVAQGIEASKKFIRTICETISDLKKKAAKPTKEFQLFPEYTDEFYKRVVELAQKDLESALLIPAKIERQEKIREIHEKVADQLASEFPDMDDSEKDRELGNAFKALQRSIVRSRVLEKDQRIDGRGLKDIRTLSAEVDVVPRVHGSALFQRGETQIMGITTLGMLKMSQQMDALSGPDTLRYMHQYNMPPFSTGETGRVGSPKRREVGHGNLAQRALVPVLPDEKEFPYAIRQVSEAIGSNGSTSMGSVCASTLSLLDAGVPLKAPVAGISMGLMSGEVKGKKVWKILTDIQAAEDAFGDMDFKVAGTSDFITALQLDTKLDGIPADILDAALKQARDARMTILDIINECIDGPAEMSPTAPRIMTLHIPSDKIGEVIGPKGKNINQIQEDTGAEVTLEDDGTVYIAANDGEAAQKASDTISQIVHPHVPKVGDRINGTVVKTTSFGAFVNLSPGTDGLLHISQIRNLHGGERIDRVEDVLKEGDTVEVVVQGIDDRGKISLAIPGFEETDDQPDRRPARSDRRSDRSERRPRRRFAHHDRAVEDETGDEDEVHAEEAPEEEDERPVRTRRPRRFEAEDEDQDFDEEEPSRPRRRRVREERDDRDEELDEGEDHRRPRRYARSRHFDRYDREDEGRARRRRPSRRFERGDRSDVTDDDREDRSDRRSRYDRSDRSDHARAPRRSSRRFGRDQQFTTDDDAYREYHEDRVERASRPRRRIVRRGYDEN